MASMTVRVCHLYPRLLSVAGDRGNLMAIAQRCAWRGIGCRVTEAEAGEVPDFTQADLILLHGGQDREMTAAAADLAVKSGPLREAIEGGAVVLAVCAGYQLLAHSYTPSAGPTIEGLGVLDAVTEAGPVRFIGHLGIECDDFGAASPARSGDPASAGARRLVGFENHSGRTFLGDGAKPLGRVIAGAGNNGEDHSEGARYREVYATYMHGPVLPKNPWFADHLLSRALAHRYADVEPLAPLADHTEDRAQEAALRLAARQAPAWRAAATAMTRAMRQPSGRHRVPAGTSR